MGVASIIWNFSVASATISNLAGCSTQYQGVSATLPHTGCPKAADWSIANAEVMAAGWRVFEVEFFADIYCTERLNPIKVEGSSSMRCAGQFEVQSAFDKAKPTLWVSGCGTESQCGFAQTTQVNTGSNRKCQPLEAYLTLGFAEPVSVNCVRILQAHAPYASEKIIITAHFGQECYRCADGAIDVTKAGPIVAPNVTENRNTTNNATDVVDSSTTQVGQVCSMTDSSDPYPCYVTLIGTPGLLGRFYDDFDLVETFGMDAVVDWDQYNIVGEAMALAINFPVSTDPMTPEVMNNTFAAVWTGFLRITTEGKYTFNINSAGHARLFIENKLVIDNPPQSDSLGGTHSSDVRQRLRSGLLNVSLEYIPLYEDDLAGIVLTWKGPMPDDQWEIVSQRHMMQQITQLTDEKKLTYTTVAHTHCFADKMGGRFDTYISARAKCDTLGDCGAVYGKNCVNGYPTSSIDLCKIDFEPQESVENSCIAVKSIATDEVTENPHSILYGHSSAAVVLWILYIT
eukprot:GEMP01023956.1.p1 GENE.GEMP01023956.1~~GEMP01023956.1.p1  ORF type:complete len:524 (+),score=71.33 GEMP01023956.1:33-1574(+)